MCNPYQIQHIYILAIGNKGSNHTPLLCQIAEETNNCRNGRLPLMFHGRLNKYIQPIVVPILRHKDQPERRSIYMLKLGKETNHARWRFSIDFKNYM